MWGLNGPHRMVVGRRLNPTPTRSRSHFCNLTPLWGRRISLTALSRHLVCALMYRGERLACLRLSTQAMASIAQCIEKIEQRKLPSSSTEKKLPSSSPFTLSCIYHTTLTTSTHQIHRPGKMAQTRPASDPPLSQCPEPIAIVGMGKTSSVCHLL